MLKDNHNAVRGHASSVGIENHNPMCQDWNGALGPVPRGKHGWAREWAVRCRFVHVSPVLSSRWEESSRGSQTSTRQGRPPDFLGACRLSKRDVVKTLSKPYNSTVEDYMWELSSSKGLRYANRNCWIFTSHHQLHLRWHMQYLELSGLWCRYSIKTSGYT